MQLPRCIIPTLVVAALTGGYALRSVFTQPTLTTTFADKPGERATFVVDGIRCRGTAKLLASLYEDTPGVFVIQTFATERKAVFTFDTNAITKARLQQIMEAPIEFTDGTTGKVFKCVSVE